MRLFPLPIKSTYLLSIFLTTNMVLSGSITPAQRYQYALNAGFNSSQAITMSAISLLECANCDMGTYNSTGDSGLWQINKIHGYSLSSMSDPQLNANAAFAVYKRQGFNAWCTYPGGCGGASKTTWSQFNSLVNTVVQSIAQSGGEIPLPSSTDTFDPSPGGVFGGSVGQIDVGGTASTSTPPNAVKLGSFAGQDISIPTGMVVGLIGVLLLLIGAIIFASQYAGPVKINLGGGSRSNVPDMASWGRGFEAGKKVGGG